jgi:hypothetical protein
VSADPKEIERLERLERLAEGLAAQSVVVTLVSEMLKMLIEKGLLNEGEVRTRLENISAEIMETDTGVSGAKAVGFIQIMIDTVEGRPGRKPS